MTKGGQKPRLPKPRVPQRARPSINERNQQDTTPIEPRQQRNEYEDLLPSTTLDEDTNFKLALGMAVGGDEFDMASLYNKQDMSNEYNNNSNPTGGPPPAAAGGSSRGPTAVASGGGGDHGTIDHGSKSLHSTPSGKTLLESVLNNPRANLSNLNLSSGIVPSVQNIVATVNVGCELNLQSIAMQTRNAEYNPKRFIAVIIRIREPKATGLIFKSGKIVITGTKTEIDCRIAARKFCRVIQRLNYPQARFLDFTIQNVVASTSVHFPIKLEKLCNDNVACANYEPELYPGLVYRMQNPKLVLLVFVSGKIVIIGARDRMQVYQAFENIFPILLKCKKESKQ